jgi:hypothetical protein
MRCARWRPRELRWLSYFKRQSGDNENLGITFVGHVPDAVRASEACPIAITQSRSAVTQ